MNKKVFSRFEFFLKLKYLLIIFIIIGVTITFYYIISNQDNKINHKLSSLKEGDSVPSITLKATTPDLVGISLDHGPYYIKAKEMEESSKNLNFIDPSMKMMIRHSGWIYVIAKSGLLKVNDNEFYVSNQVKANYNKEYFLESDQVNIFANNSVIDSDQPTRIYNNEAILFSDKGFLCNYANNVSYFYGKINLDIQRKTDSTKINIKSNKLNVFWHEKYGEFIGNVILTKNNTIVTANKMVALAGAANSIEKIIATDNVVIKDGMQEAYGDRAEYLASNSLLTLKGNVVLVKGGSSIKGETLHYDFNNQKADIVGSKQNKSNRVRAVIIPKELNK